MKGTIRLIVGLLLVLGSAGYIEQVDSNILVGLLTAAVGLILFKSGVNASNKDC